MSHHSRWWFFWKTVLGIQDVNLDISLCLEPSRKHNDTHMPLIQDTSVSEPRRVFLRTNTITNSFSSSKSFTTSVFDFEQGYGSCTVTLKCTWAGDWRWLGSFWMANSLTRSCPLRRPIFLPVDPAFDHSATGFFKHRNIMCKLSYPSFCTFLPFSVSFAVKKCR